MEDDNKPIANSLLVLREEFDDWAVLFDPDTGDSFGFNPVCVFIFKRLDGKHTLDDIMKELRAECKNAPADAEKYVRDFIEDLIKRGMAGYEFQKE
jgi:SynChlorMet cassette protein ScmD